MDEKLKNALFSELKGIADKYNEPNVSIVLHALIGAVHNDDDYLLAVGVQNIIREVLLPLQVQKRANLN